MLGPTCTTPRLVGGGSGNETLVCQAEVRFVLVTFFTGIKPWQKVIDSERQRTGEIGLRERLVAGEERQHEAVLAWLVEGAKRWYAGNKKMDAPPESVEKATREWRKAADHLLRYADEKLVFEHTAHVMSTELHLSINTWLTEGRHQPWSDQTITARLKDHSMFSVEKRQVSYNASNPPSRLNGSQQPPPQRYMAWLGVRFRTKADDTAGVG